MSRALSPGFAPGLVLSAAPQGRARAPFEERAARALTILAVTLGFGVSAMLLFQLGYNYEFAGGSAIEKMHPGTLAAFAAMAALLAGRRGGFRFCAEFFARHAGAGFFLAVWGLLLVHLILVQKAPFTPIIDTFLLPLVLFMLIAAQGERVTRPLELFLHGFMAANALIGLSEVMSGWRLIPYTTAGFLIADDWRATAMLGHPLANAALTGCYLLTLMVGGGGRLRGMTRLAATALAFAAMVAFGGRAATVLLLLAAAPVLFFRAASGLAFGRTTPARAAIMVFALFAAPIGLMALADFGAFDLFLGRFIEDHGSAKARVAMFDLFQPIPWRDLLLGPDPAMIETLKQIEGLEFGIESFWVASTLAYGLIMAGLVFLGLFLFCRDVARATRPAAWWPFGYFFAVASTSVSLSAKTCVFGMLVAMIMALLAPPARRAEAQ